MTDRRDRNGSSAPDDRTLADVSHVHPDTSETFSAVYRRGPAMADGGEERTRRGPGDRPGSGRGRGSGDGRGADDGRARARRNGTGADGGRGSDNGTMADVSHEPPYPEPNDVWTRGFKRSSAVGSDE